MYFNAIAKRTYKWKMIIFSSFEICDAIMFARKLPIEGKFLFINLFSIVPHIFSSFSAFAKLLQHCVACLLASIFCYRFSEKHWGTNFLPKAAQQTKWLNCFWVFWGYSEYLLCILGVLSFNHGITKDYLKGLHDLSGHQKLATIF